MYGPSNGAMYGPSNGAMYGPSNGAMHGPSNGAMHVAIKRAITRIAFARICNAAEHLQHLQNVFKKFDANLINAGFSPLLEGSVAGSSHMHYVSFRDVVKFAEFSAFKIDQN